MTTSHPIISENKFNKTIFEGILHDNKGKTSEEFMIDFDQCPDCFNCIFEMSNDEISSDALIERRQIIEQLLSELLSTNLQKTAN